MPFSSRETSSPFHFYFYLKWAVILVLLQPWAAAFVPLLLSFPPSNGQRVHCTRSAAARPFAIWSEISPCCQRKTFLFKWIDNHDIHTLPPTSKNLTWPGIQTVLYFNPSHSRRFIGTLRSCQSTNKWTFDWTHCPTQVSLWGQSHSCRFTMRHNRIRWRFSWCPPKCLEVVALSAIAIVFFPQTHLSSREYLPLGRVLVQFHPSWEQYLTHGHETCEESIEPPISIHLKNPSVIESTVFVAAKKHVVFSEEGRMEERCRQFKIRRQFLHAP